MLKIRISLISSLVLFGFSYLTAQSWVKSIDMSSVKSLNSKTWRVVKSVVVDDNIFTAFAHVSLSQKCILIKANDSGTVVASWLYSNIALTNMTTLKVNGQDEILIIGSNSQSKAEYRRLSPVSGDVLFTRSFTRLDYFLDAEQCHTSQNKDILIVLGREDSWKPVISSINLTTNKLVSSQTLNNRFGNGLAVSSNSDIISVGFSTRGSVNAPLDIYSFKLDSNWILFQTSMKSVHGSIAPKQVLQINTRSNSVIDAMASIPGSDNVIFSYHNWMFTTGPSQTIVSGVGVLELTNGQYSINHGSQTCFDYGSGRRVFDISVNDLGTEVCFGSYTTHHPGSLKGTFGIQRLKLQNSTFASGTGASRHELLQELVNSTIPIGSSYISVYKKNELFSAVSISDTANGNQFFSKHVNLDKKLLNCFDNAIRVWTDSIPNNIYRLSDSNYALSLKDSLLILTSQRDSQNTLTNDICVSSNELNFNKVLREGMNIFPNPASDVLYIHSPGFNEGNFPLKIFNQNGAVVMTIDYMNYQKDIEIDVHHLPNGIYLLKSNNKMETNRFMINK